jgi:HSP20 family protein
VLEVKITATQRYSKNFALCQFFIPQSPASFLQQLIVTILLIKKLNNMHYNQSCAAKGNTYGSSRGLLTRSMQRATVNIYKTTNSYEMLVFAPGRIKEHFHLGANGNELTVSYTPPEGFTRPEWILREYSRGGFTRSFTLNESIDTSSITAKYTDGVLQVSLPVIAGKENVQQEIVIN